LAQLASLPTCNWSEGFAVKVREEGKKDEKYQKVWKLVEAARKETEPDSCEAREDTGDPCEAPWWGRMTRITEALEIKDSLLYRKGILWIPEDRELIRSILESEHNSRIASHMGQDKTNELIRRHFWWPKMVERIIDYV